MVATCALGLQDVNWAMGFLASIVECTPPSSKIQAGFVEWKKQFITATESLVVSFRRRPGATAKLFLETVAVTGKPALQALYDDAKMTTNDLSPKQRLDSYEVFRMFEWCLLPDQQTELMTI